jgi:hypothetical protein
MHGLYPHLCARSAWPPDAVLPVGARARAPETYRPLRQGHRGARACASLLNEFTRMRWRRRLPSNPRGDSEPRLARCTERARPSNLAYVPAKFAGRGGAAGETDQNCHVWVHAATIRGTPPAAGLEVQVAAIPHYGFRKTQRGRQNWSVQSQWGDNSRSGSRFARPWRCCGTSSSGRDGLTTAVCCSAMTTRARTARSFVLRRKNHRAIRLCPRHHVNARSFSPNRVRRASRRPRSRYTTSRAPRARGMLPRRRRRRHLPAVRLRPVKSVGL